MSHNEDTPTDEALFERLLLTLPATIDQEPEDVSDYREESKEAFERRLIRKQEDVRTKITYAVMITWGGSILGVIIAYLIPGNHEPVGAMTDILERMVQPVLLLVLGFYFASKANR